MKNKITLFSFLFLYLFSYAQTVTTIAGGGVYGYVNGIGTLARFYGPTNIVVDTSGNLFVADSVNNCIRKITPSGEVSTFVGNPTTGSSDGTGTAASFNGPFGIAIDGANNLYVTEMTNNKIRKITPAGVVTTYAGSGSQGSADGSASVASFYSPRGIVVDNSGNLFVADIYNNKIRKITPAGVVSTVAGNGSQGSVNGPGATASFHNPSALAIDASNNLYVSHFGMGIRKITPSGMVSTYAGGVSFGSADGPISTATFSQISGIAIDNSGNFYIGDSDNNKIRKISSAGIVSTLAGNGVAGTADGPATIANFLYPHGVALDASGNIYVAEYYNHNIRKITMTLSTSEVEKDDLEVVFYPNPVQDFLTIKSKNKLESYEVYSSSGQTVLRGNLGNTSAQINMSAFTTGIYYVKVKTEKGVVTEKVTKR